MAKRGLRTAVILVACLVPGWLAVRDRLPSRTVPAGVVARRVNGRVQAEAERGMRALLAKHGRPLPREAVEADEARAWEGARRRMLTAGSTSADSDGVLAAARSVFAAKRLYSGVLAIPYVVEPEWADGHRVWVLGFGWACARWCRDAPRRPGTTTCW